MVNPEPSEVEELTQRKLVGFNNRRYDNHILYGRILGYTNEQLFLLSQKIIKNVLDAGFREAYNLSYADIYDSARRSSRSRSGRSSSESITRSSACRGTSPFPRSDGPRLRSTAITT